MGTNAAGVPILPPPPPPPPISRPSLPPGVSLPPASPPQDDSSVPTAAGTAPIPVAVENSEEWEGIANHAQRVSGAPLGTDLESVEKFVALAAPRLFWADSTGRFEVLQGMFAGKVIAQCEGNTGCLQGARPLGATVTLVGIVATDPLVGSSDSLPGRHGQDSASVAADPYPAFGLSRPRSVLGEVVGSVVESVIAGPSWFSGTGGAFGQALGGPAYPAIPEQPLGTTHVQKVTETVLAANAAPELAGTPLRIRLNIPTESPVGDGVSQQFWDLATNRPVVVAEATCPSCGAPLQPGQKACDYCHAGTTRMIQVPMLVARLRLY